MRRDYLVSVGPGQTRRVCIGAKSAVEGREPALRICYVACPTSLTLESANAIQTHTTLRELTRRAPATLALVPRWLREPSRFAEVGARHLPRPAIGKLSRLYRTTLWYYAERSVFAAMTAGAVLWERVRGRRVDVVYVREVICAGWWTALFGRILGVPVVYEAHDLESRNPSRARERWIQPLLDRLDRCALGRSAAVVSLTEDFRNLLDSTGWRRRADIAVIPDAFDDRRMVPGDRSSARSRIGVPEGAPLLVYAGMTFSYRGLDRLLEAFARVRATRPGARLALVGGRPTEVAELRAVAAALPLEGAVTWASQLTQAEVLPYLQAADVLVIPDTVTDVTASPLKLFEYLAVERVVVLPDIPALQEILPREIGYYFRRGDVADMARAIEKALDDPARRPREAAGREAVKAHTYAARAERIVELAGAMAVRRRAAGRG
jgi:glycosyltransferase involved in cell wall biosynthesis